MLRCIQKVETAESKSLSLRKLRHFLISKTCSALSKHLLSAELFVVVNLALRIVSKSLIPLLLNFNLNSRRL